MKEKKNQFVKNYKVLKTCMNLPTIKLLFQFRFSKRLKLLLLNVTNLKKNYSKLTFGQN